MFWKIRNDDKTMLIPNIIKIKEKALKCPWCGAKMSAWQKSSVTNTGIRYNTRCKSCGEKCIIPNSACLIYIGASVIVLFIFCVIKPSHVISLISAGICMYIASMIIVYFVPLIKKED